MAEPLARVFSTTTTWRSPFIEDIAVLHFAVSGDALYIANRIKSDSIAK